MNVRVCFEAGAKGPTQLLATPFRPQQTWDLRVAPPILLQPLADSIRFVVVLWGEPSEEARRRLACPALRFEEVLERGRAAAAGFQPASTTREQVATLVYTSGTTGHPKVRAQGATVRGAPLESLCRSACIPRPVPPPVRCPACRPSNEPRPALPRPASQAVALSHGNLLSQVESLWYFLKPSPGDTALSLLPPWHIYERTVGYYLYANGG